MQVWFIRRCTLSLSLHWDLSHREDSESGCLYIWRRGGLRQSSLPGPWGNNWTGGSPGSVVVCCLDSGVTDLDDFVSHTPRHPRNRSWMVMGLKGNYSGWCRSLCNGHRCSAWCHFWSHVHRGTLACCPSPPQWELDVRVLRSPSHIVNASTCSISPKGRHVVTKSAFG